MDAYLSKEMSRKVQSLKVDSKHSSPSRVRILSIPDHILLDIFSRLSFAELCMCARVCQRWYEVSKCYKFRKRIVIDTPLRSCQFSSLIQYHFTKDLEDFQLLLDDMRLPEERHPRDFRILMSVKKDKLWKIGLRCDKLKTIVLQSCSLCSISLKDLPSTLTHLSVRGSEIYPEPFFGPNPSMFVPHLVCLDIGGVSNFITSQDLHVFTTLKSLRNLYMEGCFRINNGGIDSILELLPQLEILDVEGTDISNEGAVNIFSHCVNIKELFIGHTHVDDAVFLTVEKNAMPLLSSFCVMDTKISSMGLHSFLLHCSTARKLSVKAHFAVITNFKRSSSPDSAQAEVTPFVSVIDHNYSFQVNECQHHLNHKCNA